MLANALERYHQNGTPAQAMAVNAASTTASACAARSGALNRKGLRVGWAAHPHRPVKHRGYLERLRHSLLPATCDFPAP